MIWLCCRWVGEAAQHRHSDRQRDYSNQPRDEFGRPVPGRHADKPWHEYRPAIAAAAEPSARLSHPPPPGTLTTMTFLSLFSIIYFEIVYKLHIKG